MQTFSWKFVDDFNFWKFWLCLVFTAAHGPSLVGASGGYCLVVVCGLLIQAPSFITAWKWAFSWCLLSPLSSSHSFLFFASIFYGLLVRAWLMQYNIKLCFWNIQILAFCLEHLTQSLQLDSLSLSSLYFLSSLLDFCLGSCGIKSSYVKTTTLFRIGCLGN